MRAKRESMEKHRHECAESGDDEDEELGDVSVREKSSPRSATKTHRGSKLGTEMMRTNSRGSVVSSSDVGLSADIVEPPPTVLEEITSASEINGVSLTPPEVFSSPGSKVAEIGLNETPKQSTSHIDPLDEEPTPRAPSVASNHGDYIMHRNNSQDRR